MPPLLARILHARGLTDPDEVQRFCTPRLTDLCDPVLLPNVDAAAERLVDAARAGETIAIYGDYDVDGITATAILHHVIRAAAPAAPIVTYVPHRVDEGYGLNADALRALHADGARVVVTVDCGVTAVEEAAVARSLGLDLIITDHHSPPADGTVLPDALIVHPRLPGSAYPFGELCGAGVAFKLAWRFAVRWCGSERVSANLQRVLLDMLPLVALGTIADVVPLVGENRVLTSFGLRTIRDTKLTGLRALIDASGLAGEQIDSQKVGFRLAPRLNAIGRMGHAAEAMRLLTDAEPAEAIRIAEKLATHNAERQKTERRIVDQAARLAEDSGMTADDRRIIVLAHDDWHPGVVGIVCSRLVDRFGRPAILLQRQGDVCKGSARSIDGFSIHAALTACGEHLEKFGGHEAAAGLTIRTDRLDAFTEAITAHAGAAIDVDDLVPRIRIDCDACMSELDHAAVKAIAALSPFGRANRSPTVRLRDVTVEEPPRRIGANGRHLSLRVRGETARGRRSMRLVWWSAGSMADRLASGMRLDLAIEPKLNDWNGRVTVEGEIRDVCIRDAVVEASSRPDVEAVR